VIAPGGKRVTNPAVKLRGFTIGEKGLRRLALAHGVLPFFCNTVILALTIKIAASFL
jgi:uncharacterized membrane protein